MRIISTMVIAGLALITCTGLAHGQSGNEQSVYDLLQ